MHKDKLDTTFTPQQSTPLSVSQLTNAIKQSLESNFISLVVQGELSNCKLHSSGHFYFDLKDAEAKIPAVMFRAKFNRRPKEGDQVILKGSLSVYPPHGRYQFIARELSFAGVGELLLKFEELKKKLHEKGWFDQEHKKPLPQFPKTIGVITSETGAVIQDIIHVLRRRSPGFHLRLIPVHVQGEVAAGEIAAAIRQMNQEKLCDVMIVGRGGGSLEDLWAFNEEIVAKAIFESEIPIISAVGHETDVTLADFVADVRAPTPSAAAEIVSAQTSDCLLRLNEIQLMLDRLMKTQLVRKHEALVALSRHPLLASPLSMLHLPMQKLDQYSVRLDGVMRHRLDVAKGGLTTVVRALQALDPKKVLGRGYSILFDEKTNHVISSSNNVQDGTAVKAVLSDGTLQLVVKS